jgi:hypothetical protein
MADHHLTSIRGNLYIQDREGDKVMILCVYPDGDCDTIAWPFKKKDNHNLVSALFDHGNMGIVENGKVYLPDGKLFGEIVPCGFNPE